MKNVRNIYSFLLVVLLLTAALGCQRVREGVPKEAPSEQAEGEVDERGFDPLALPADRTVLPRENPKTGLIQGNDVLVDAAQDRQVADTSAELPEAITREAIDTLNNQAYRVQLVTSEVFGEARHEARIAEEIFDRPVTVDYEVPYYKVRVGKFADRDAAERYQQKARTIGYDNAWVVAVTINVRGPQKLYEGLPLLDLPDSILQDSVLLDSVLQLQGNDDDSE